MLKLNNYLQGQMNKAFQNGERYIQKSIRGYCENKKNIKVLDVGCGDGLKTLEFVAGLKNIEIHGTDLLPQGKNTKIKYKQMDFESKQLPYSDNSFDIVFSNQVIEHMLDKESFLSESRRVLKKNGLFLCATENIASFDNITSLLFGQEPLSQHTGTTRYTNSFLSPHFMKKYGPHVTNKTGHKNVTSYFGLKRLTELTGFRNVTMTSFGSILRPLEIIFPIYNRIIIAQGTK